MPKDYSPEAIAKSLGHNSDSVKDSENEKEEGETLFVQIALTILSGFIFGFIWTAILSGYIKRITEKFCRVRYFIISCIIPFASVATNIIAHKKLEEKAKELDINLTGSKALYIITGIFFPILPLNIIGLSVMQYDINKILKAKYE